MHKTFIVDIGKAWTKAYLVDVDDNKIVIDKKLSLPTSVGDVRFSFTLLASKLRVPKDVSPLLTGSIPEAETLAKNLDIPFVSEEDAKSSFAAYLDKDGFKSPVVLDAGDYKYSPTTKINHVGAFLSTETSEVDIENYFGNKSLRPRSIATQQPDLEMEEAFLRTAFAGTRDFINAKNVVNLVLSGSFISLNPHRSKLALLIADIMFAGRVAQVKLDKELFAHGFGALLKNNPKVADYEASFLIDLGAFISFGNKGKVMLDYGLPEKQEISIVEDEIALIPTLADQQVKVTFLDSKEKAKINLHGGLFGLVLDGRIKPLKLAFGRSDSRDAIRKWSAAVDKMEAIS